MGHALSHTAQAAALRLHQTYAALAQQKAHLFAGLLDGQAPRQWSHYPDDDAFDLDSGFQWFYHSHSPQDRPDAAEHGHIHLFARRKLWSRRLRSAHEKAFASLADAPAQPPPTRHLLCIGFDAKGLPTSLFTVNSWVTGDLMLSALTTLDILAHIRLNTGHPAVDAVIESVVRLYSAEIQTLLHARDALLLRKKAPGLWQDESLELLSECPVNVDEKLSLL